MEAKEAYESGEAVVSEDVKLFIGGIEEGVHKSDIRSYFEQFGKIISLTVKKGSFKDYAFLTYKSAGAVEKAASKSVHIVKKSLVYVLKDKARHGQFFVGGLKPSMSINDIKSYFSQFGRIVRVEQPCSAILKQSKRYCFITYDDMRDVNNVLKLSKHTILEHSVYIKPAIPSGNARLRKCSVLQENVQKEDVAEEP